MNSKASNPYVGSRTFEEGERDRFFGRDTEARDLLALVVSERLVVFYAQSGAGKSSLVNTCLIPDLRSRGYEIFTGRVVGDAPTGIQPDNIFVFNLLRSLAAKERKTAPLASQTISGFLKQHTGANTPDTDEESLSTVLIVDQFEEIFSTHHEEWEKREGFFKQLAQALEDDRYLSIVLVMREDYIASLDPYSPLVPSRFRRRYYMQRLEREAALEAVKKPVEDIRPYEDDVAERLVNDLSSIKIQRADETTETQPGQFVEGVQLQLVCFKLWKGLDAGDRITHADLDKLGDVNLALEEHYSERVREVAERKKASERLIREWFGKKLITPAGTRNLVLRSLRRVDGELPDDVIQALQSDLVRAEQRGASAFYELTHDRLVEPILANNKKWFENLSPLQRQAALWIEQGRNETWLFSDPALAEAEAWAKEHQSELTQFEKEFLKESQKKQKEREKEQQARQRRIITNLSIVAILVTTGLAMFGIFQATQANKLAITAQANLAEAKTAQAESESNESAAQTAQAIAELNQEEVRKQLEISRSSELAAQAQRLIDEDLQSSLLVGVESFRKFDTPQSRSALLDATLANPQLLQFLSDHTAKVSSIAYSPDGKFLASGSFDDTIRLWDMERRQPVGQSLTGHADDVTSVAFSPNGKILASGSGDSTVIFWDVETGQPIGQPLRGNAGYISTIAFSPDGQSLASGSYDGTIFLWDVETGQLVDQLAGHTSYVSAVTFSPNGKILASGGGENTVLLWDVGTRRPIGQPLSEHSSPITTVAFSPDGKYLASGSYGTTIILWDVATRKRIGQPLVGHDSRINSITFSPDGATLLSGSDDNTVAQWDVSSIEAPYQLSRLSVNRSAVNSVAFNPDGKTFSTGGSDGTIGVWTTGTSQTIGKPLGDDSFSLSTVAFNPDGTILASGSYDGTIVLWDVKTRQRISQTLSSHSSAVSSVAFSPDGIIFASGSYDNTIILWDINRYLPIGKPLSGHAGYVSSVVFSPTDAILASSGGDDTISLWSVETRQSIGQLTGDATAVFSEAFSPDGKILASGGCGEIRDEACTRGEITLWDMETLQSKGQPLAGHTSYISSVAFSPDGATLASGSYDNTIILWDVETGQPIGQPLTGHSFLISRVAFSPDGKTLASSSYDGSIILWDVKTRQPIGHPIVGQDYSPINTMAFSPDGQFLASGSDVSLFLWDVDPNSWIVLACQRAGRNFTLSEWERYFPGEEYRETCPQWTLEPEATATPSETQITSPATATMTPAVVPATATVAAGAIPATATQIPSRTPTATVTVLYRVINVVEDDVLNLRAGPGTKYDVLTKIPHDGRGIQVTGAGIQVDNAIWLPVIYDGISGWVNSYWLAPE